MDEIKCAETASVRPLSYLGFVPTNRGHCSRCGRSPDGTGRLHALIDMVTNERFEFGYICFPYYIVPALYKAYRVESDSNRQALLKANIERIGPQSGNRAGISRISRPAASLHIPVPPNECVAGGYEFRLQAVGEKTFTVRVHDNEMVSLGKAILRHDKQISEQAMGVKNDAELTKAALHFCSHHPSTARNGYRILRFRLGFLANRHAGQS